jgi:hypothetical protein
VRNAIRIDRLRNSSEKIASITIQRNSH